MKKKQVPSPRRHPIGGGYPRGEEVRARIIRVAIEAFGEHGYGGASTRTIAEMAGISAPALQYYFGGKQRLYIACAEFIASVIGSRLASASTEARRILSSEKAPSRKNLVRQLHSLLTAILEMLLESDVTEAWTLFVMREQAHPTAAFETIFDKTQRPVIQLCAALIARLLDLSEDDSRVVITAFSLYGQITSFRTGRESVLRVLGTRELDRSHFAQMKAVLFRQINCLGRIGSSSLTG